MSDGVSQPKKQNKNVIRCKDARHGTHKIWGNEWCPHAKSVSMGDPTIPLYDDFRCLGWLRRCEKTGKIVVHNKKCDAE